MTLGSLRGLLALLASLTLGAALGACGGEEGADAPDAADIPAGAVAVVGDEAVTRRQLDLRVAALRRSQRGGARQDPSLARRQAMSLLLQEAALEREAADLDIEVTRAQVRKRVDQARRQFRNRRQFERFLGGQTEGDLLSQLRIQALTERLAERAREEGQTGDPLASARARWRARTACRSGYVVPECGNARAAEG